MACWLMIIRSQDYSSAICEIASKPELIEHYQRKSMNGLLSIISNLSKVGINIK